MRKIRSQRTYSNNEITKQSRCFTRALLTRCCSKLHIHIQFYSLKYLKYFRYIRYLLLQVSRKSSTWKTGQAVRAILMGLSLFVTGKKQLLKLRANTLTFNRHKFKSGSCKEVCYMAGMRIRKRHYMNYLPLKEFKTECFPSPRRTALAFCNLKRTYAAD